jgi:hypothetical protein
MERHSVAGSPAVQIVSLAVHWFEHLLAMEMEEMRKILLRTVKTEGRQRLIAQVAFSAARKITVALG